MHSDLQIIGADYVWGSDPLEWVGFDFDGTLFQHLHSHGAGVGEPIWPIVDRLKFYLYTARVKCKIFTARVSMPEPEYTQANDIQRQFIWDQLRSVGIQEKLDITCKKDMHMILSYDDRILTVQENTGVLLARSEITQALGRTSALSDS